MKLAATIVLVVAAISGRSATAASGGGSNTDCASVKAGTHKCGGTGGCDSFDRDVCLTCHDAYHCCFQDSCDNAPDKPTKQQSNNQQTGPKKKKGCFHSDDSVQSKEYGSITIRELADHRRDAHVLTRSDDGALEYAPVRYWLHAQPNVSAKFVNLRTESGHELSLTGEHLIYETECNGGAGRTIFAKNVRVGGCLFVMADKKLVESKVTAKSQKKLTGVYSPITSTGSIVVNDVLASCYNYYENEALQKFVYQYMIGFQDTLAQWLPSSIYQAAFNNQDGALVAVPRIILTFLHLSSYFVH